MEGDVTYFGKRRGNSGNPWLIEEAKCPESKVPWNTECVLTITNRVSIIRRNFSIAWEMPRPPGQFFRSGYRGF